MKSDRTPGMVPLEIVRSSSIIFGKIPLMLDAATPMSADPCGPVNEYANVGSSPFPCTHRLTASLPEVGRVIVKGEPCALQALPLRKPMKSTLIGDEAAAVVGSATTIFSPVADGWASPSETVPTETSYGITTNGTGFESAPGDPGFCT